MINYNNKIFRAVSNAPTGEVSGETVFCFSQHSDLVTAVYEGGEIVYGTLIAIADTAGVLDMRYQHVNKSGEIKTGKSISTPEVLSDGRIRLHDKWQWTCDGEESGESILEETDSIEQ